ncbi:hypothetical protein [Glutamicibacter protophormiae]|uniref:Uncharacterized protein n=1 Tax=Glutamicibacter protophormiae TaxID=37930 RepID=A0ABS4XM67_GLUPR|nr:hypothetical protein [Glutamicibacter protophormiae]MBP2397567.1 hypothetical protein [Glutamicibacter protophormiae]GGL78183.1 hypothetical protein GCM10010038_05270 [Glutamicibacter protophormiae]
MTQNSKYSVDRLEGTVLERMWRSVIMSYPNFGGQKQFQSAGYQAYEASKFAAGLLGNNFDHVDEYIARWIAAGFTPELYWALNESLGEAVKSARRRCVGTAGEHVLEQRLRRLGVLAPNPRRGQSYIELQKAESVGGVFKRIERRYPEHIVQLVPEEWEAFPPLMLFARPSVALAQFISAAPVPQMS